MFTFILLLLAIGDVSPATSNRTVLSRPIPLWVGVGLRDVYCERFTRAAMFHRPETAYITRVFSEVTLPNSTERTFGIRVRIKAGSPPCVALNIPMAAPAWVESKSVNAKEVYVQSSSQQTYPAHEFNVHARNTTLNAALCTPGTYTATVEWAYQLPADFQYLDTNGHVYTAVTDGGPVTWDVAQKVCGDKTLYGMRGYLVAPSTTSENAFLGDMDRWTCAGRPKFSEWQWVCLAPQTSEYVPSLFWGAGMPMVAQSFPSRTE